MRLRAKGKGRVRFALYLDGETVKALRLEALRLDTSASAVVEHLVTEWLKAQAKRSVRKPRGVGIVGLGEPEI